MHQKPTTYERSSNEASRTTNARPTTATNSSSDGVDQMAKSKFRLLICSPSNGGCDELTRRLKQMRKDRTSAIHAIESWRGHRFNIIRVGRADSIHSDCDDVGFEAMVKAKVDQLICKKQSERSSSLAEHYNTLLTTENNLRKKISILKTSSTTNQNNASFKIYYS